MSGYQAGRRLAMVVFLIGFAWMSKACTQTPPATRPTPAVTATPTSKPLVKPTKFIVFDARAGRIDRSSATAAGMKPLKVLYGHLYFFAKNGPGRRDLDMTKPDESLVRKTGKMLYKDKTKYACVDVEHWPLKGVDDAIISASITKLNHIMQWLRAEAPDCKIGCYSMPPIRDYWRAIKGPGHPDFQAWQAQNKRLAKLGANSDIIFPSIYTFFNDPVNWKKYAIANIRQARQYGKPVYPFIWPQFHGSNKKLAGQYLSVKFWRLQLETCYKYADGVSIWGYWPKGFDENAPWWQETLRFMKDKNLTPAPPRGPHK